MSFCRFLRYIKIDWTAVVSDKATADKPKTAPARRILCSCRSGSTENAPQVASAKTGTKIFPRLASSLQLKPEPRRAVSSAVSPKRSSADAAKILGETAELTAL